MSAPAVLLIGADAALLEGVAQTLAGAGFQTRIAIGGAPRADEVEGAPPLVVMIERPLALERPELLRVPVASGGALLLFHGLGAPAAALPLGVPRLILADLALPLERHRLLALLQRVQERARITGRTPPPPERHAP